MGGLAQACGGAALGGAAVERAPGAGMWVAVQKDGAACWKCPWHFGHSTCSRRQVMAWQHNCIPARVTGHLGRHDVRARKLGGAQQGGIAARQRGSVYVVMPRHGTYLRQGGRYGRGMRLTTLTCGRHGSQRRQHGATLHAGAWHRGGHGWGQHSWVRHEGNGMVVVKRRSSRCDGVSCCAWCETAWRAPGMAVA